jgi:hypothetical protein
VWIRFHSWFNHPSDYSNVENNMFVIGGWGSHPCRSAKSADKKGCLRGENEKSPREGLASGERRRISADDANERGWDGGHDGPPSTQAHFFALRALRAVFPVRRLGKWPHYYLSKPPLFCPVSRPKDPFGSLALFPDFSPVRECGVDFFRVFGVLRGGLPAA